jgi:hypothetical protein
MKKMLLLAVLLVVSGCAQNKVRSDNFQPYLSGQRVSIPMAQGDEAWVYPAGTKTAAIIQSWKDAGLVMHVKRPNKKAVLNVDLGPNFYALAPAQQRGLAHAIAEIYGVDKKDKGVYMVRDSLTRKVIGSYTQYGLQFY